MDLAVRAGTSRPTLSSYEHGRRSPTLTAAARILAVAGYELVATPRVTFTQRPSGNGRTVLVPSHLPRLDPARAFATVTPPLHLNWSEPGRTFDLRDRRQRARVYEIVLREGAEDDVLAYVDGVLLVDLFDRHILATMLGSLQRFDDGEQQQAPPERTRGTTKPYTSPTSPDSGVISNRLPNTRRTEFRPEPGNQRMMPIPRFS